MGGQRSELRLAAHLHVSRLLITGSRDWWDAHLLKTTIHYWVSLLLDEPVTLVHGNCPIGADALAEQYAIARGWQPEPVSANWTEHGLRAGPLRNQLMVDLGADLVLAFPLPGSKGTWDTVRRARAAGLPTLVTEGRRRGPGDPAGRPPVRPSAAGSGLGVH